MPFAFFFTLGAIGAVAQPVRNKVIMRDSINIIFFICVISSVALERVSGIEPPYLAWEASILPLNYTRVVKVPRRFAPHFFSMNILIIDC